MPAALRRYWAKKRGRKQRRRRKAPVMAKRRRRSFSRRRRSGGRRRRGGGGSRGGFLGFSRADLEQMAGCALYGFAEGKAKADGEFVLNKLPKPIDAIGYAGNVALAATLVNKFLFRNHYLAVFAKSSANIAAYQMGRKGGTFTAGDEIFVISGVDDDMLSEQELGALAPDANYEAQHDDVLEGDGVEMEG